MKSILSLCQKHGSVSIFDEVITGFRLALGGAREYFGLYPDISVYAKAIAGGFTMAAIGGSKAIFEVIRTGATIHAGTYNGSSINLAASLATLEILSDENCYQDLHAYGYALREHLEEVSRQFRITLVTSGTGSIFSLHFGLTKTPLNYTSVLDADMEKYERFRVHMLHEGILLLPDGRWYVGTSHGAAELEKTKTAITNALSALR